MTASSWNYFATRLHGDGTETVIANELPLGDDTSFTHNANAPIDIQGSIAPEYSYLLDEHGDPLLRKWSTAIYAECDGQIRAGGIYVDDAISDGVLQFDCMGFAGYPNGQPFTEGNSWPLNPYPTGGIEPMDALRKIWSHLQSQRNGNLGVVIDPMNTGKKIGKMVAQGEFDTENGVLSFEYTPFTLRNYETFDLGETQNSLAEGTPFEYREEHSWNADHTAVQHFIRVGHPRLGSRRHDYRFAVGDNIQPVSIDPPDDEYADTVLGLGAGEGAAMIRSTVYRTNEDRIRRAVVFEDKAARTAAAIRKTSMSELAARVGVDEVTSISVLPPHVSDLIGVDVGDEVPLSGETAHRDVEMWVRVLSKTQTPATGGLEFAVARTDRLV